MELDKILIIDDSKHDRFIMRTFLAEAGYKNLLFAETGEEGLEIAKAENPNLVIVDALLPGIGGLEVCKKLKGTTKLGESTKVIVTTGYLDEANASSIIFESGADDCVVKTKDCLPLIEAVKKLLPHTPNIGSGS